MSPEETILHCRLIVITIQTFDHYPNFPNPFGTRYRSQRNDFIDENQKFSSYFENHLERQTFKVSNLLYINNFTKIIFLNFIFVFLYKCRIIKTNFSSNKYVQRLDSVDFVDFVDSVYSENSLDFVDFVDSVDFVY